MGEVVQILFTALGGGASIGASAHLLRIGATSILIDFGINPSSAPALTFRQLEQGARASGIVSSLTDVTAVVLTHAHTDHSGLLPALYRMFKDENKRVPPFYASACTKGLLPLIYDTVLKFSKDIPYRSSDVESTLQHIRLPEGDGSIDWLRPELGQLRFHGTSHLLGSVMVQFDVGGRTVLHTGDLQMGQTPSLPATEIAQVKPDLLIVDGTYAGAKSGRVLYGWEHTRDQLFGMLDEMLERRSVVLLPSFALGRSQDILALVLEHAESREPSTYYVYLDGQSSIVTQSIYPRFSRDLSPHYLGLMARNQWRVKPVANDIELSSLLHAEITGYPAVVIASSGMLLPNSASRRWAEALIGQPNNLIAFTGYVVEDIREEVFDRGVLDDKPWLRPPRQLGCSSHASIKDLQRFVEQMDPQALIVVHCGGGDMEGPGSLFSWASNKGCWVTVGRERKRIIITNKGVQTNDF